MLKRKLSLLIKTIIRNGSDDVIMLITNHNEQRKKVEVG